MRLVYHSILALDGRCPSPEFIHTSDVRDIEGLRRKYDAVVFDSSYVALHKPEPSGEYAIVLVDENLQTPPDAKLFEAACERIVATVRSALRLKGMRLEGRGVRLIEAGSERLDVCELLRRLEALGFERLLVEGCGNFGRTCLERRLIDEIYLTLLPILGGVHSERLFDKPSSEVLAYKLMGTAFFGDKVVLHYARA